MRSLYVKLALSTVLIMLLSGLFAFMFANFYYQQKLKPANDAKNTAIALDLADYIEAHAGGLELFDHLDHIAGMGYQLFLTDGAERASFYGDPFRDQELSPSIIDRVLAGEVYHGMKDFPQETFVTGFFANELTNTIGVPFTYDGVDYALFMRPNIKLLFNEMHFLFAWLLGLTISLSIIFVLVSTKYLIRPISKLTEATQTIAKGDFDLELDIKREDEIGQLAASFTHMVGQLEKLDHMRNDFISSVSHDIQSPLSNIKGYIELLEKGGLSEAERTEYFSIVRWEIERLSHLTKQLLMIVSLDHHDRVLEEESFAVNELLRQLVQHYQYQIQEKDLFLRLALPEVTLQGDKKLLYAAFENILTNAIKYNLDGGSIQITLEEKEEKIELVFQDTGIGFTEAAKARAFERFFREDQARGRDIPGTGLGLVIAKFIIEMHGGDLWIESEEGKGTRVHLTLAKM